MISMKTLEERLGCISDDEYVSLRKLLIDKRPVFEKYFVDRDSHNRKMVSEKRLEDHEMNLLEKASLIERSSGVNYISEFRIYYIDIDELKEPIIITTDFPTNIEDRVFPWIDEGKIMIKNILSQFHTLDRTKRILNMFCGAGTITILLAALLKDRDNISIDAVDSNKRAIMIANFNKKINNLNSNNSLRFIVGDMFSRLEGCQYDFIVADPPFALQPPSVENKEYMHSSGGMYGEEKIRAFLSTVKQYLNEQGHFHLLAYSLGTNPNSPERKIKIEDILKDNALNMAKINILPDEPVWRFYESKQIAMNPMPVQYMVVRFGDKTYRVWKNTELNDYVKWIEETLVKKGWTHLYYLIIQYSVSK